MKRSRNGQGGLKNRPHHIIFALDLTTLKFNGILTVDFLKIQSNKEWRFSLHIETMLTSSWICGAPSRQPTRNLHKGLSQRIWILIKAVNGLSPVHILFLDLIVEDWAQV